MFLLLLLLYIIYISMYFLKVKIEYYTAFISITLALFSYAFDPVSNYYNGGRAVDTVRIFQELDLFSVGIMNPSDLYGATPLSGLYLYFFAYLGDYLLLPAVTCLFTYSMYFFSLNRLKKIFVADVSVERYAILYFVYIVSVLGIAENIRQPLALSIYFLLLIYDLVENKNKKICYIGYLCLPFFHSVIWIANIFRLLIAIPYKYGIPILILILYIVFGKTDLLINLLVGLNVDVIQGVLGKFNAYESATNIDFNMYYIMMLFLFNVIMLFLTISMKLFLKLEIKQKYSKLLKLSIYLLIFGFGSHIAYYLWHTELVGRMNDFLLCISMIYIYIYSKRIHFDLSDINYKYLMFFVKLLLWIQILMYFLANMYITSTIMI